MVTSSASDRHDDAANDIELRWVLLVYRLPREPSAPRLALWRAVRRLGALQVVDGLVGLPYSARNAEHLEWLAAAIEEDHGSAAVWVARPMSSRAHVAYASASRASVEAEYESLLSEARAALSGEPSSPDARRSLRRLRRRLRQIGSRDYFAAAAGDAARAAVERLAQVAEEIPA